MRGFFAIFKRELFAFFVTPLAWIIFTAFVLIQGLHFYFVMAHFAGAPDLALEINPVQGFFGQTVIIYLPLLFVCPILTMRLFAEERRSGTIEALMTTPVTPFQIVLGKYLAVLTVYIGMWLPTVFYAWQTSEMGYVDWWVVASCYLAVIAVGAGYLAIGTMSSALSRTQLAAAIISSMTLIALFIMGIGAFIFPEGDARALCSYLSVWGQMNDLSRGVVDSRRLILDATLIVLPLFITTRAVESWRAE